METSCAGAVQLVWRRPNQRLHPTADAFKVREASAADIPALARLHVTTRNATYAPLLMKGPSYNVRERQWREAFAKNDDSIDARTPVQPTAV